ncbi:photoreceptor cilium actin regulator [Lampetra fluviatilis]
MTSSGRRGDDGEHTTDDSDADDDGHIGYYVPREKDIVHVCVEERLRERIVNSASLVMSEVIAGQPAFAEDLIAKIKASSKVDDFEYHCPAVPENVGETREDGNPERERRPSEADGQEERSKIDFPDGMVEAHKAVYEYLNHTLHDYDDMMNSADQIVETQQSLQQMISFLFFKCEEINSTMQSAVLTGEALLKSLKFGLSTQCSDKMEGLDLPQQVLCYSVNKLQGISDSTNSTTSGALNLIVGYMKSAHEKLQEKMIAKMRLDSSVAATMAQLALHAVGAAPSPGADERATALSDDSGIAADNESLSELCTDSPSGTHACARRDGRRCESWPPGNGHTFVCNAVCQLEGTEPPGNRSMSHHCALEKQFKDVFYPPQISMFAESRDTGSAAVGRTALAPLDHGMAEQGRSSFLRSLDALADEIVDEAHVEVGVLDATWDRKREDERQIDFAKQHVMQIVGNSSEMDELVLKLKEAISSRILFMSPGPPDPEWSEEEGGKLQSGNRPKTAQGSPSKGANRRRSRSADSLANQQEDVTLRELHRVQKSIAKCLETTFQTAKQSVLMDKQRRPKISSAAQGSQPRSSRIKTSLDKGFSVLPNHGLLKGNKNEQPKSNKPSQHLQRRQAFRRLPSPPLQPGHSTPCPLPSPPGEQRKLPSPPLGQRKLPSPPPHGRQRSPGRLSAPSSMFKAKNMTDDQSLYNNASSQYQTDQHQQQQLAHALCKGARSAAARASKEECEDDSSGLSRKFDSADDGGRADAGLEYSCVAQGHGDPRKLDGGPDFLVQGRGICSPGPTEEN